MKLTQYTDYCIRVLVHVALKPDRLSTTQEISENFGISTNHVMKIVYDLNIKGYLKTVRGRKGGIRLGRAPQDINLGALIREVEEGLALAECHSPDCRCVIKPKCILHGVLQQALKTFFAVLDGYTLANILEPREDLIRLIGLEAPAIESTAIPEITEAVPQVTPPTPRKAFR